MKYYPGKHGTRQYYFQSDQEERSRFTIFLSPHPNFFETSDTLYTYMQRWFKFTFPPIFFVLKFKTEKFNYTQSDFLNINTHYSGKY